MKSKLAPHRLFFVAVLMAGTTLPHAQWIKTNGPDSAQALASGSIVVSDDVLASALVAGTNHGGYVSTDGGTGWFLDNGGLPSTDIASVAVAFLKTYIAPAGGGVYMSENEGTLWQPRNEGLTNATVHVLESSPSQLQLYAGTNEGVFRTVNSDNVWVAVPTGMPNVAVHALAVSDSFVYAGTDSGVFVSADRGESWTVVNTGLTAAAVRALAFSPSAVIAVTEGGGVFRSLNRGAEWTAADSGLAGLEVHALTQYAGTFFAGTDSGVFVSADHGSSWTTVNTGLASLRVWALMAYGALYAGADSGLWRRPLSEFLPSPDSLVYAPDSFSYSDTVLPSWNPSVTGSITAWSVSPALPSGMSLDVRTGVISGEPSETINGWKPFTVAAANASGSSTRVIYIENPGPVGVHANASRTGFQANAVGAASFTLSAPGRVTLTAFTPSGRQVAVLLSRDFPAGSHRHRVDAAALPAGLYVFRLQAGGRTESRKVLLTR